MARGLSNLNTVLCAVGMSTWEATVELALDAIPDEGEINAAITAAKTFAENGFESDLFQRFAEKTCRISNWDFQFQVAFGKLKSAPKDCEASQGCTKDNKKRM